MLVREIMHRDVFCTHQEMRVRRLYSELRSRRIAGCPVLDRNGLLIGVVTLGDIARYAAGRKGTEEAYSFSGMDISMPIFETHDIDMKKTVADIMNSKVFQVSEDATVEEALEMMISEDIHRVVITAEERVVGIVTSGDMMRLFLKMLRSSNS